MIETIKEYATGLIAFAIAFLAFSIIAIFVTGKIDLDVISKLWLFFFIGAGVALVIVYLIERK